MANPTQVKVEDLDIGNENLDRELDRVKARVFLGKHAAFLGSLLAGLDVVWSLDVPTAGTNGLILWWNPYFFLKSAPKLREATLVHELWHVARLHNVRCMDRDPEDWNIACDYCINNDMTDEGFVFEGFPALIDKKYKGMYEEEIYDDLQQNTVKVKLPSGASDLIPLDKGQIQTVINTVVTAVHQAKIAGAGKLPGSVEEVLNKFLNPIVPWEQLLARFFEDLLDTRYTWARPNRRYPDMYLPSREDDDGRLEHLIYFCDVSGSISSQDALRFNSEVKHIKDTYNPLRLTLVQFDTQIQKVDEFTEDQVFDEIKIVGRGGTSLDCVRDYIEEHQPTAAVIFSDLYCAPMPKPNCDVPIIWVVVNNAGASVDYGKLIHIKG